MKNNNHTLIRTHTPVKRRQGFYIFPGDMSGPITPEQLDSICDLYVELNGKEPKREKLAEYGELSQLQASIKIEIFQMRRRIESEDTALKGNSGFYRTCEKRVLTKHGYRYYKSS